MSVCGTPFRISSFPFHDSATAATPQFKNEQIFLHIQEIWHNTIDIAPENSILKHLHWRSDPRKKAMPIPII